MHPTFVAVAAVLFVVAVAALILLMLAIGLGGKRSNWKPRYDAPPAPMQGPGSMQKPPRLCLPSVPVRPDLQVCLEWRLAADKEAELFIWLPPAGGAARMVRAGGFWLELTVDRPLWVFFEHRFNAVNQAAFAACRWLEVHSSSPSPSGVWLFPPRSPRQRAGGQP